MLRKMENGEKRMRKSDLEKKDGDTQGPTSGKKELQSQDPDSPDAHATSTVVSVIPTPPHICTLTHGQTHCPIFLETWKLPSLGSG